MQHEIHEILYKSNKVYTTYAICYNTQSLSFSGSQAINNTTADMVAT